MTLTYQRNEPMSTLPLDAQLAAAQLAIGNALSDAEIQAPLSTLGYNAARLQAGRALYDNAMALHTAQRAEYGEQMAATVAFRSAWEGVRTAFMRHLKLARLALVQHPEAATALALYDRRQATWVGWAAQARLFYENLLARPDWVAALASYGQTEASLQGGRALLESAEAANQAQEREKGEARNATLERDVALDALDDWMVEFRAVARIAFADDVRQLDKLGF
jgi:hypothetical protein